MCRHCDIGPHLAAGPASPARRAMLGAAGALSLFGLAGAGRNAVAAAVPKPANVLTPDQAVERLMQGNQRYVAGQTRDRNFSGTRAALAGGQNPYACILSCADSRISPEFCFDEERGDLFVTRVAGNYLTNDILASLEYGVAVLGTPLIMVLGHTRCGAVQAAVDAVERQAEFPGHLQTIVTALAPAVRAAAPAQGEALVQAATIGNVRRTVDQLRGAVPVVSRAVQSGRLRIVGAVYALDTGAVELVA